MLKIILIGFLLIGFVLQLVLIAAMFRANARLDMANQRIFFGLVKCMDTCQARCDQ